MGKSMNLILAQGAEHTKPENLRKIVNVINEQRFTTSELMTRKQYIGQGSELANRISNFLGGSSDYIYGYISGTYHINLSDYSVEEKYDGYSYLNVDGRFFSKRLSDSKETKGQPIEKTGHLKYISNILERASFLAGGLDLHGEIYIPDGISDDVTKILGCTEDKAQYRLSLMQKDKLPRYKLIDIRSVGGNIIINEQHRVRRAILEYVYKKYIMPHDPDGYINLTEELYGDPRDEFKRIVLSGREGIIIKREDALYVPDKKPANNWIKGKKKITHDVFIVGLNDGTGKNASLFGSIEFAHIVDGKTVKCGNCSSGLSDSIRSYIYNNADRLIRDKQVFEIEAIQESVKSFRNAVFLRLRDDKGWEECKPENIRIKEDLL